MIECTGCNKLVKETDFYGKENCYKCTYKNKKKETEHYNYCKRCHSVITNVDEYGNKKNTRWRYCSQECAKIANEIQKREYWVTKVKQNNPDSHMHWKRQDIAGVELRRKNYMPKMISEKT